MSELIQLEMTLDEARETDRLIKRHINTTRYLLLDMRDRKGWKALGYESFKEYGEKELGYEERHIYRLVDAAEIGLQIGTDQLDSQPSESHLRPLKSVPEEVRREIWEEATRKAQEEGVKMTAKRVEEAVAEWKQRTEEFRTEANQRRQTIRELEIKTGQLQTELEIAKAILDEKPSVVVQAPDDYKKVKEQAAKLKADLKEAESKAKQLESSIQSLKKEQKQAVDSQVNAKMREYQNELDAIEEKKRMLEEIVDRKKAYLDSLSSEVKRIETHQSQIAGTRLELISLAAFLNDLDPIQDSPTIKQWLALADMLDTAAEAIHQYINKTCSHPTVRSVPSHSEESLAA